MKGTATLENVIEKVHTMSADNYDEVVPVKEIEFTSLHSAKVSGMPVAITQTCQQLIANKLRVPNSYLNRCPPDLQAENLNYWIKQEQKKRDTLFCRFSGKALRAMFSSTRYEVIDNMDVLAKMLEYGFPPDQEVQYNLDGNMMVLKMPEYNKSFEIQVKDRLVPGISFINSEVGKIAFMITSYLLRLICTNGLLRSTPLSTSRFKHISKKPLENFPAIVDGVMANSQQHNDELMISVETSVEDPESTIKMFNRQFNIVKAEGEAVIDAWAIEPAYNMWGIVNGYTRAAQAPSLSAEASYQLEKTGGAILSLMKR